MSPSESLIRDFWRRMATNDFWSVTEVLADDFVLEWPQTNERIRGPENFARMNAEYPTRGTWTFVIHRLVAAENEVVTHVDVSDGERRDEAISFFTLADGKITRIVEFWPEKTLPAHDRRCFTEPIST